MCNAHSSGMLSNETFFFISSGTESRTRLIGTRPATLISLVYKVATLSTDTKLRSPLYSQNFPTCSNDSFIRMVLLNGIVEYYQSISVGKKCGTRGTCHFVDGLHIFNYLYISIPQ